LPDILRNCLPALGEDSDFNSECFQKNFQQRAG